MTRGKRSSAQYAKAGHAAVEHIDRLTDQLVEAKQKAKLYEDQIDRLAALEVEVGRLRAQVRENTSDKVIELEATVAKREEQMDGLLGYVESLRRHWEKMSDWAIANMPGTSGEERVESFLRLLQNGDPTQGTMICFNRENRRLRAEQIDRLVRARRERSPGWVGPTEHAKEPAPSTEG